MKIYLAGGFHLMTNKDKKERKYSKKFSSWKRLFSFFYADLIYKSEIFKIKQENQK